MAMNTGTKLMLGLGAIGIVVGILVMVLGAGSIGDADNWRPTDDVYLENSQEHHEMNQSSTMHLFLNLCIFHLLCFHHPSVMRANMKEIFK